MASSTNPLPQLTDVIGVLGAKVVVEPSLSSTLSTLFGTTVSTPGTGPSTNVGVGTVPTQVQSDLNAAQSYYEQALAALKAGDLGTYQSDIDSMDSEIQSAQNALKTAAGTTTSPIATTTTTTTSPVTTQKSKTKAKSASTSKAKVPTSTEPKTSTTTTTLASASAGQ